MLTGFTYLNLMASDKSRWSGIKQVLFCYAHGYYDLGIQTGNKGTSFLCSTISGMIAWTEGDSNGWGCTILFQVPSSLTQLVPGLTAEGQAKRRLLTGALIHRLSIWFAFLTSWWLGSESGCPKRKCLVSYNSRTPRQKLHSPFWLTSEAVWHHFDHILLITKLDR